MDRLIASIEKKDHEEIRVSARELKGRRWVDLRVFGAGSPAEEKWPTGKGFLLSVDDWKLFREGVVRAEKELKECGWIHE